MTSAVMIHRSGLFAGPVKQAWTHDSRPATPCMLKNLDADVGVGYDYDYDDTEVVIDPSPQVELLQCICDAESLRAVDAMPPYEGEDADNDDVFVMETEEEQRAREAAQGLPLDATLVQHFQFGAPETEECVVRKRNRSLPSSSSSSCARSRKRQKEAEDERWHTLFFNIALGSAFVQLCAKLDRGASMAELRRDLCSLLRLALLGKDEQAWTALEGRVEEALCDGELRQRFFNGAIVRLNLGGQGLHPPPGARPPQPNAEYERFEEEPDMALPLSRHEAATFLMYDRDARDSRTQNLKVRLVDAEAEHAQRVREQARDSRAHPHLAIIVGHLRGQMQAPQYENPETHRFEDPEFDAFDILRDMGLNEEERYLSEKMMLLYGTRPPVAAEVGCLVYNLEERRLLDPADYSVRATQMYSGHVALRVVISRHVSGRMFLCARIGNYMSRSNVFVCGRKAVKRAGRTLLK